MMIYRYGDLLLNTSSCNIFSFREKRNKRNTVEKNTDMNCIFFGAGKKKNKNETFFKKMFLISKLQAKINSFLKFSSNLLLTTFRNQISFSIKRSGLFMPTRNDDLTGVGVHLNETASLSESSLRASTTRETASRHEESTLASPSIASLATSSNVDGILQGSGSGENEHVTFSDLFAEGFEVGVGSGAFGVEVFVVEGEVGDVGDLEVDGGDLGVVVEGDPVLVGGELGLDEADEAGVGGMLAEGTRDAEDAERSSGHLIFK